MHITPASANDVSIKQSSSVSAFGAPCGSKTARQLPPRVIPIPNTCVLEHMSEATSTAATLAEKHCGLCLRC
eukprot:6180970-Pleurochrysis_carterae.AAC.4